MELRDISDFINKEYNAKVIGIASCIVIFGSSLFLGSESTMISNKLENANYKEDIAMLEKLLKGQDKMMSLKEKSYKIKEDMYKGIVIEDIQRESIYRSIISGIMNSLKKGVTKKNTAQKIVKSL